MGAAMVFVVVLVTRLPFLGPGYGIDPDAWRMARAAKAIAESGVYVASRMPGHPPHEYALSVMADASAADLILLTAAVSAVAAVLFWLLLRHFRVQDSFLAVLAFALTPVVYIESVELLDYVWSQACVLGGMYLLLLGKRRLAGILLGVAIGFGITIALMALPFALMAASTAAGGANGRSRVLAASETVIPAVIVAVLCFIPPFLRYGPEFLRIPEMNPHSVFVAGWMASVGVFGIPGSVLVVVAAGFAIRNGLLHKPVAVSMRDRPQPLIVLAWLSVLVLYALFYLRIRGEPSKLIPIVPFLILLLARYTGRTLFVATCVALPLSSFAGQLLKGVVPGVPSILQYASERRPDVDRIANVWRILEGEPGRVMLITGSAFEPKMDFMRPPSNKGKVEIRSWVTASDIESQRDVGVDVICLQEACAWNERRMGIDPRDYGARAIDGR